MLGSSPLILFCHFSPSWAKSSDRFHIFRFILTASIHILFGLPLILSFNERLNQQRGPSLAQPGPNLPTSFEGTLLSIQIRFHDRTLGSNNRCSSSRKVEEGVIVMDKHICYRTRCLQMRTNWRSHPQTKRNTISTVKHIHWAHLFDGQ